MAEEAAAMEARESAYRLYNEERQARLKQERISRARKIAPGFLDNDDRRILTPTMATAQVYTAGGLDSIAAFKVGKGSQFDYSEFEANDNGSLATGGGDDGQELPRKVDAIQDHQQQQQQSNAFPSNENNNRGSGSGSDAEEEVIVQAVPLSELTGMLSNSCLDDESSSSAPRQWVERDTASE
ncbi:hypothetical protein BGZ98_004842, partial [Dissophora globulifera]